MPPPSPYNLNRWIIVGGVLMVVTGLFASRGRKPALEMEREQPSSVTSTSASTMVGVPADASGAVDPDELRFRACNAEVLARTTEGSPQRDELAKALLMSASASPSPSVARANAAVACEAILRALNTDVGK